MNVSPPPAERRKNDSTSMKRPANVLLASFLTDICGFDPEIPESLAKFQVTSSEDLAVLRDEHLANWFDDPFQIVILCRLQMVRHFLEHGGDPHGVTDFTDLRLQTTRLVACATTESAPVPAPADSSSSCTHATIDDFIRLKFPDGRVLECSRSTLTNRGGYLAARFGDNGIPAGAESRDANGRGVYFVERDGRLFEDHILPYLITGRPGKLQRFWQDPELWRLLRDEAVFYGLDGLSERLSVTHTCIHKVGNDRGVLYWLGTDKGTCEYRNPHATGAVRVGGWVDLPTTEREALRSNSLEVEFHQQAYRQSSLQSLVQYQPPVKGISDPSRCLAALDPCFNFWCGYTSARIPTVIDLQSISLRLTAYSLRYDICGMSYWNLEASEDGSRVGCAA